MWGFIPLPHTVSIVNNDADSWGVMTETEEKTVSAKISYNTKRETISVASGEEVVFTAGILIEAGTVIGDTDNIVFEDAFGNRHSKPPLKLEAKSDLSGNLMYIKVFV